MTGLADRLIAAMERLDQDTLRDLAAKAYEQTEMMAVEQGLSPDDFTDVTMAIATCTGAIMAGVLVDWILTEAGE